MNLIDKDALKKDVLDLPNCYNGFSDTFDKACIIGLIDEQPTVEERKWIPCGERLPEKSGRYLVTRGLNAAGAIWNRVYIVNYSDLMGLKGNRIFWQGNVGKSDFEKLEDVLAWMPLPESYSGETELRDYKNKGDDD